MTAQSSRFERAQWVTLSMAVAAGSCSDCPPTGFRAGERYRVEIVERIPEPVRQCEFLQPGDQFGLTEFALEYSNPDCRDVVHAPEVPPFLPPDVEWHCGHSTGPTVECESPDGASFVLTARRPQGTQPGVQEESELHLEAHGPPFEPCRERFRVTVAWEE